MSEINDLIKNIGIIESRLEAISLPYLKELEGAMKYRIHNQGKDSDNNQIGIKGKYKGRYSPGYEKRKEKIVGAGDLYPINLQLRGDLLKSFTVLLDDGKYVLKIQDDLNRKKADRHEKNYNTAIYKPSEQELDDAKEILVDSIRVVLLDSLK